MGLKSLLSLRTVVVTGAGGVGKTTVACALSRCASKLGKRVLCVEIGSDDDDFSAMAAAFGVDALTDEPTPIAKGLSAMRLRPRAGYEQLARDVLPSRLLDGGVVRSAALRSLLRAVPVFTHVGILYRWLGLVRAREKDGSLAHDLVVLDLPTRADALALVALPRALARTMPMGSFATSVRTALAAWCDPQKTGALVVTHVEPTAVTETIEALETLEETGLKVAGIVVNRVPYDPFSEEEHLEVREILASLPPSIGERTLQRIERARLALGCLADAFAVPTARFFEVWLEGEKLVAELASSFETEMRA